MTKPALMYELEIKAMEEGVQMLLGKVAQNPAEILKVCDHASDGFIYEKQEWWTTLGCRKCGQLYEVDQDGNKVQL